MTTTTDILVVGAGMAGVSAAARLAPHARVTVLETEERPAYHTTSRSAAIFILNYGNAILKSLNQAAEEILRTGGEISDTGFLGLRGMMYVAAAGHEADLDQQLAGSVRMEEISPDEAVRHFPLLRRDKIVRATIEREASDIDVDGLFQAWLRRLRAHGGEVVTRAEATTLRHERGAWRVETPAGTFKAPLLVNAAGAWGDVVAGRCEVAPVGLQPLRRSIAVVPAPDGHDIRDWPMVASAAENWYAKPDGGRLWISPADEDPVEPHDAWPDDMVLAEGIDRFQQMVDMEVTRLETSWAGLRTFAPDRTPVVGFEPGRKDYFWLCGQGGYGIQTSPALSRLAADLILGQSPALSEATVAALSPARFRQ